MKVDRTWLVAATIAAIGTHSIPFLTYVSRDVHRFVRPWFNQLAASGFSEPFGNYTPPYLYLLWCMTWFDGLLWQSVLIKLLSVGGALWVVYASSRVLKALEHRPELALLCLLLPSIILNASLLAQADTFWVAPCLLATAAAIRGEHGRVSAWAGLAFAVKAQAAFFAPFVILLFVRRKVRLSIWLLAPAAFSMAMLPAILLGWPPSYIASIYVGQLDWVGTVGSFFVGNGASL